MIDSDLSKQDDFFRALRPFPGLNAMYAEPIKPLKQPHVQSLHDVDKAVETDANA